MMQSAVVKKSQILLWNKEYIKCTDSMYMIQNGHPIILCHFQFFSSVCIMKYPNLYTCTVCTLKYLPGQVTTTHKIFL